MRPRTENTTNFRNITTFIGKSKNNLFLINQFGINIDCIKVDNRIITKDPLLMLSVTVPERFLKMKFGAEVLLIMLFKSTNIRKYM